MRPFACNPGRPWGVRYYLVVAGYWGRHARTSTWGAVGEAAAALDVCVHARCLAAEHIWGEALAGLRASQPAAGTCGTYGARMRRVGSQGAKGRLWWGPRVNAAGRPRLVRGVAFRIALALALPPSFHERAPGGAAALWLRRQRDGGKG